MTNQIPSGNKKAYRLYQKAFDVFKRIDTDFNDKITLDELRRSKDNLAGRFLKLY